MGRQAIIAAIDLGDCKRDALARRRGQGAFVQGAEEAEIAFERGGAQRNKVKQVRHGAEHFLYSLQHRLGLGRGGPRQPQGFGYVTLALPFEARPDPFAKGPMFFH